MMTFADRLAHLMKLRGLSQGELARRSGLKQDEISRLVAGKRSRVQYLMVAKLARATHVSVEWLGEGRGDPPTAARAVEDPFTKRTDAARICREGRVAEHGIERVLAEPVPPEAREWPTLQWIKMMELAASLPSTVAPHSPPQARSQARPRADIAPPTTRSSLQKK